MLDIRACGCACLLAVDGSGSAASSGIASATSRAPTTCSVSVCVGVFTAGGYRFSFPKDLASASIIYVIGGASAVFVADCRATSINRGLWKLSHQPRHCEGISLKAAVCKILVLFVSIRRFRCVRGLYLFIFRIF